MIKMVLNLNILRLISQIKILGSLSNLALEMIPHITVNYSPMPRNMMLIPLTFIHGYLDATNKTK